VPGGRASPGAPDAAGARPGSTEDGSGPGDVARSGSVEAEPRSPDLVAAGRSGSGSRAVGGTAGSSAGPGAAPRGRLAAPEPAPTVAAPAPAGPSPALPPAPPRSPLGVGSVVTRCQSSTISNGRWTMEQAWWEGTAAGSSLGSRTRTRRPPKADRTRSMAWVRRGVGRSMTTASMVSAGSADQAWMVRSSVTRPVPWSSALRARPSEGSRRSSTTWRDMRGAPTWRRRR
jgi:hypothetical protein